MSLFQFHSYIDGSLHVSGPQAHLQENSHSCPHNHWFSIRTVLVAFSVCTKHATRRIRILNQWLWGQLCEVSWRWACGSETCRDPSIYEQNWNSDISWFFIPYAEKMHGTKSLKLVNKMYPSLNFSLLPAYRKSCFKILQPQYKPNMKGAMWVNIVLTL